MKITYSQLKINAPHITPEDLVKDTKVYKSGLSYKVDFFPVYPFYEVSSPTIVNLGTEKIIRLTGISKLYDLKGTCINDDTSRKDELENHPNYHEFQLEFSNLLINPTKATLDLSTEGKYSIMIEGTGEAIWDQINFDLVF